MNLTNCILMQVFNFLMCMCLFYIHVHLDIPKHLVKWHIVVLAIYSLIEGYLIYMPLGRFQVLASNISEIVMLYGMILIFTDNFLKNIVRQWVACWMANTLGISLFQLISPAQSAIFLDKKLDVVKWQSLVLVIFLIVSIFILEYPLMKRIFRDRPGYDGIYDIVGSCIVILMGIEIIVSFIHSKDEKYYIRYDVKSLLLIMVVLLFFILVMIAKQQTVRLQKKQLQNRMDTMNKEYDEVVKKNRELHKIRHELSKQAEALRVTKGYVPEETRKNMMREISKGTEETLNGICLSGNLMLDTLVEKYYKEYREGEIVLETVIEPVVMTKETEDAVCLIQEEMFRYAHKFNRGQKWIRYSLRSRGKQLLVIMEIGYKDMRTYKRKRMMYIIGDRMLFRYDFEKTYAITERRNGCVHYDLNKESMLIGVMLEA